MPFAGAGFFLQNKKIIVPVFLPKDTLRQSFRHFRLLHGLAFRPLLRLGLQSCFLVPCIGRFLNAFTFPILSVHSLPGKGDLCSKTTGTIPVRFSSAFPVAPPSFFPVFIMNGLFVRCFPLSRPGVRRTCFVDRFLRWFHF